MTLLLRPADAGDLDALVALELACFENDGFQRRQLAHLLTRAHARTLVLVDSDDAPCGYGTLLFRCNSRIARLYSFCIHPAQRGGGHGRRMLEAFETLALAQGRTLLQLEVRADNRSAIALYRRMGFEAIHWLDDYYADGCAGWKMVKRLTIPAQAG